MIPRRRSKSSVVNSSTPATLKSLSFDQTGILRCNASASKSASSGSRRPICRRAPGSRFAYSVRSTILTGRAAAARISTSTGKPFFRARTGTYSSTSAIVCSVVKISLTLGWPNTNRARPPMSADKRTLASAASFTACLSPAGEIFQNVLLGDPLLFQMKGNLGGEHGKKLALQIEWQGGLTPRNKDSGNFPAPSQQNRIVGPKQGSSAITELANGADSHVVTPVTILLQ